MNGSHMNEGGQVRAEGDTVFALLQAAHALEDRIERALAGVGLSIPKYSVLSELVREGNPVALSDLAGRLACVKSNMTQLIDRLEAEGLVRRVNDPADRRLVKAGATDEGRAREAAGRAEVDRLNAQMAATAGKEERAAVRRLFSTIG